MYIYAHLQIILYMYAYVRLYVHTNFICVYKYIRIFVYMYIHCILRYTWINVHVMGFNT